MPIMIDNVFEFFDIVYLKTDCDQKKRMVNEIRIDSNGVTSYGLSCGTSFTWHYDSEISKEKDFEQ